MYNKLQNNEKDNEKDNENKPKKRSFVGTLHDFLDNKTNTILSVAAATAIAFGFKDLVLSIAINIVHPLFIKLIAVIGLSKYINHGNNNSYNIVKNFMNFIISLTSFISILLVTYYLLEVLNNTNYIF